MALGCQLLEAATSVGRRFLSISRPSNSLAAQRRYADFGLVSLVANVASLIGRLGSSAFKPSATTFQTIHYCSVDVAHGLALLFGIGTKALPLWDSRTRRNNLLGDLAVRVTAGSSDITNSPHPSSREGHLSTA